MATPLELSNKAPDQLQRVRTTHDALVDLILLRPELTQKELAKQLNRTPQWVYLTINSTVFQERLAQRKSELVDPTILATIDDKLQAVANRSMELLLEKLNITSENSDLLSAMSIATKALGYGANKITNNNVSNFVVALPPKAENSTTWLEAHKPQEIQQIVKKSIEANEISDINDIDIIEGEISND